MKILRKWTKIMLFAVALCFVLNGKPAFAADTTSVNVKVIYGQTEARKMLTMINEFRQSSDAWYWNSDDTNKTTCSSLSNLVYDENLEAIAMQRAAEIAISFAHTRPDGESWYSYTVNGKSTVAENIAVGQTTAQAAFESWREDDKKYDGQGHRRNMLGNYTAVGIGHVYFNGTHYWVQEFGYSGTAAQTVANDSETTVEMNVLNSNITAVSVTSSADTCSLYVENSVELPTVTAKMKLTDTWPVSAFPVEIAYEWTSANSQVAKIENNALYGVSVGDTTISAVALGNTVSVSVNVKANATEEANKNATGEEAIKDASKNANKDENKNVSDNEDANENEKLSLGQEVSYKNANYVITGIDTNEKTVAYQKADNTKAKKIKIPSDITIDGVKYKVTTVSANAFKRNKQVTSITIPSSVEKIGKNAFSGCKKLKTIVIKTSKLTSSSISKNAFKGVPNSTVVKVAKNKVKKYAKLFRKKGIE